jgi:acetyl esterase/lipase
LDYPFFTKDLKGSPPALIMAAMKDVLCDDDRQYAMRFVQSGVKVKLRLLEGFDNGFAHTRLKEAT